MRFARCADPARGQQLCLRVHVAGLCLNPGHTRPPAPFVMAGSMAQCAGYENWPPSTGSIDSTTNTCLTQSKTARQQRCRRLCMPSSTCSVWSHEMQLQVFGETVAIQSIFSSRHRRSGVIIHGLRMKERRHSSGSKNLRHLLKHHGQSWKPDANNRS